MDARESTLHLQIQFFTRDEKFLTHLPDEVINVPASSDTEQLNLLLNKISEVANENWESTNFDFLIDSILLRTSLSDFIETFKYSLESTLKLECIQQTSAPQPHLDLADAEWVADLKMTGTNCILSVNFGGELILWNGAKKVEKAVVLKLDDEPLKCLQVFRKESEAFALVGAQNQTLTLLRIEELENKKKQKAFALTPLAVFRGHQRSVECVAVNREGTRAASGSFDKCIKVWNIDEISSDDFSSATSSKSAESESRKKRARPEVPTKTPMVTLQSHREVVSDIGWNPLDPGQAVTVSWDQQMLVWDLELAGPIANLSSSRAFTALALNPHNGLALTGSTDPLVRLWDFRSKEGSMVKSAYSGHLGWVTDVCWSPDKEQLFASASLDKTVKLWDIRSPKAALYDLMGHEDRVLCVDWSVSERIGSGSVDCSIKIFSC